MADDHLRDYILQAGLSDCPELRGELAAVVQRFRHKEEQEKARALERQYLSKTYFGDWSIETFAISERFPPSGNEREYDGVIESCRDVNNKYARRPHVSIVLNEPRGAQFKLAVMLDYQYQMNSRKVFFSDFRLLIAVEPTPPTLGADVQRELIESAFRMLNDHYPVFVKKMKRYSPRLEHTVMQQVRTEE